jgi:hypothetical protein
MTARNPHMMVHIFALVIFLLTATAMPMPSTPQEDLGCGVNIKEFNPSKPNATTLRMPTNLSTRDDAYM